MTRTTQKLKIKEINRQLLLMASLVEKQLYASLLSLKEHDTKVTQSIIAEDDKVDELQRIIEEECIKFIATEQPVAVDLRSVFTASKIVTDLERMADYAVDICKITNKINGDGAQFTELMLPLWDMEEAVREMLDLCVNAYVDKDVDGSYSICKMDDKVDEIYKNLFADIIKQIVREGGKDESKSDLIAQLLFVAKYLERVGDHITNICEWTIYSETGEYVDLND